jgi:Tol biopolymer transport system component
VYFGSRAEKRAVEAPFMFIPGIPSPDGRFLPHSEASQGNLALYDFSTGQTVTLTSSGDFEQDKFADVSAVSPDGSRIAYDWSEGGCDCEQLRVIDVDGSNMHVLVDSRGANDIVPVQWSPDNKEILGTRKRGPEGTDVVLVSAETGSVRLIRSLDSHGSASLSPDGRFIAYDRVEDADGKDLGIFAASVEGGDEVPITAGPTWDATPLWTPDGSGIVFSSTRTGGPGLWLQPIHGGRPAGPPQLLDKDMGPFQPITLTRNGSLFFNHRSGLMDVFTAPIEPWSGELRGEPVNAAKSFLGSNMMANWSRGGDLIFVSWRTLAGPGRNVVVLHSTASGEEREIEPELAFVSMARWTRDGSSIVVAGPDRRGARGLRLVDPQTGNIVSPPAVQGDATWSESLAPVSDGRYAYRAVPAGISRREVQSGKEEVVCGLSEDAIVGDLSLSPDGRWLAFGLFTRSDGHARLAVVPADGGPRRDLVDIAGSMPLEVSDWTHDGGRILFVRNTRDSERRHHGDLFAVPLEGGAPQPLGLSGRALRAVRVSPDGTRIAYTMGYPDRELWVFENFLPEVSLAH